MQSKQPTPASTVVDESFNLTTFPEDCWDQPVSKKSFLKSYVYKDKMFKLPNGEDHENDGDIKEEDIDIVKKGK